MSTEYEHCPPNPEAMISSLRAFGYDLAMAIADLIDNSIYANANNIQVDYDWNSGDPWIRIIDDGEGMNESILKDAMRLGSQSPLTIREENDLGRFGLGLKTASFSQCKHLIVRSKTKEGVVSTRCWDLDHVVASNKWEISKKAPLSEENLLAALDVFQSGTIVLWKNLDRLIVDDHVDVEERKRLFVCRFENVTKYLEMVFHRFLSGKKQIALKVGIHDCLPWDPFLRKNVFTESLSVEKFENQRVIVKPYILPHVSKRSSEESTKGAGIYGWNAHQGLYIYRNKRMIIPGGYLDYSFTPEEHFKLCRIQVDLPNGFDHEWGIDVRKAAASPPGHLRNDFERIVKATRTKAVNVYRARSGQFSGKERKINIHDVWLRRKNNNKIYYEINRQHEIIRHLLGEQAPPKSWVNKLFHIIEKNVPHRIIIMDNADSEDCHVNIPCNINKPPDGLLRLCKKLFLEKIRSGLSKEDSADLVCSLFDNHVDYRVLIDGLIEEMQ